MSGCGARQKQVGNIRAGDCEYKADRAEQDQESRAYIPDEYLTQGSQRRAVSFHAVLLAYALGHRNEFGAGRLNCDARLQTRNRIDARVTAALFHLVGVQSDRY